MSLKDTFKKNKAKFLTVLLFIAIGVVILFWGTFEKTSDSAYCSSCHMMKPEAFTWQASSHSNVECVACHVPPGVMKKVQYKLFAVKEVYAAVTGDYGLQIQMTQPIPSETCTECHNMTTRQVSPSGDIIIPHDKHEEKGINCSKCHSGIAHGNIVKQRVTLRTDYTKWDESFGKRFMDDKKNIRPDMDTCMDCHKLKKGPLECAACHKTSMLPNNHKEEEFKNGGHGKEAGKGLKYCDSCHNYMSTEKVEVDKSTDTKYSQYLSQANGKPQTMSVSSYAKTNTFCKDCHGKRPFSHKENLFLMNHGLFADQNKDRCFTCHDNKVLGNSPVTQITCGSCHPSSHYRGAWRTKHPIELPPKPKVTELCYTCHNQQKCAACHSDGKQVNTQESDKPPDEGSQTFDPGTKAPSIGN